MIINTNLEIIKEWLNNQHVEDSAIKDSLFEVLADYERLLIKENTKDYKKLSKEFIGEEIVDFFCNGFFGSRTFDLSGGIITDIKDEGEEEDDSIVISVKKLNERFEYGEFNGGWKDWKQVYEHLIEWTKDDDDDESI